MKKRIFILTLTAALALGLTACGEAAMQDMENSKENLEQDMENGMNKLEQGKENLEQSMSGEGAQNTSARYSENDLEFDIPESWRSNFLAEYREHNADTPQGYSTVDFYYTAANGDPFKIMTVARFTKDAWNSMTRTTPAAAEKKLGESKDGEWIYSLSYETEPLSQDAAYLRAHTDAQALKDKIKITK